MNLIFLGNSYHLNKTKSSLFFLEVLKKGFDVSVVPHKEAWSVLPDRKWDVLVTWQNLYTRKELEAFGVPRVILIPMWDDCPRTPEFWKSLEGFSVIAFSAAAAGLAETAGLACLRVKYYPPVGAPPESHPLGGFFWQRNQSISWSNIRQLWGRSRPEAMLLHLAADPGFSLEYPDAQDTAAYRIRLSSWFDSQEQLKSSIRSVPVYFAPREAEGIGMSFLEALAQGRCVVAPDAPTMNEYIEHGVDGLLYTPGEFKEMDFTGCLEMGQKAWERAREGRAAWEASESAILEFIRNAAASRHRSRGLTVLLKKTVWYQRLFYRFLKRISGREA